MDQTSRYGINVLVMLPALVLLSYIAGEMFRVVSMASFLILSSLPVIKRLLPKQYRGNFYPLVILAVLLLILLSIMTTAGIITVPRELSFLIVPLTETTFLTLGFAWTVAIILEGLLSPNIRRTISYLLVSMLPLLDQVFVIYLMNQFGYSYQEALTEAYFQQAASFLLLLFAGSTNADGYNFPPPLSTINIPLNNVVLITLILAVIGFMVYFILESEKPSRSEATSQIAYSLFLGALLALVTFLFIKIAQPASLDLFVAALAVLGTLIAIRRSSPERYERRLRKRATVNKIKSNNPR
ncbi:MAG TPA: hypothetical protein VKU79_06345 [Thermoplasmataceae archaeon]|nr:hypothetical protein [Thermoplasmatales archaeon AK]HLH86463.1 hypothetical protein [Thermoplasmataceae archaeon]